MVVGLMGCRSGRVTPEEKLTKKLVETVQPSIDKSITNALGQVRQATNAVPNAVSQQVAAGVSETVTTAFRDQFASVCVPGYERATQAMFEQMHSAFNTGMAQFKMEVQASTTDVVKESVQKATSAQESLLAKFAQKGRSSRAAAEGHTAACGTP